MPHTSADFAIGDFRVIASTMYSDSYLDYQVDEALDFTLVYKGDVSKYSKLDWIQNYITFKELEGKKQANDYKNWLGEGEANPPFYYPKDKNTLILRKANNKNYGGEVFKDKPSLGQVSEYSSINATYFIEEVSLVGMRNGKWEHVATFMYGFTVTRDGPYMHPTIMLPVPSQYQQNLINSANK